MIATAIVAGGLAIRLTIRDLWPLSAWIYYALPWPLLAATSTVAVVSWLIARRVTAAAFATVLCISCALALWQSWTHHHPCVMRSSNNPSSLRVLFWNISRGRGSWDAIARRIQQEDADIIALAEAGKPDPTRMKLWQRYFPDAHIESPGGGLLLLARGRSDAGALSSLPGISSMYDSLVTVDERAIRILLVDLDASPRFDKRDLVGRVFERAGQSPSLPTIVLGDFNTPIDSRWFDPIRSRYAHAFERSGSGIPATWPARHPLVAIDHIWLSQQVTATCARLIATDLSDHRAFVADVLLSD